jgi:hypothetical protein
MTEEEQLQQRMMATTADAVAAMNRFIAPLAPAIDASPGGVEALSVVAVLNAYAQALSENLSLDALKTAAQLQAILFAQMKKD